MPLRNTAAGYRVSIMKRTAFSPHDNCYVNYLNSSQKHDMPVQHYHDAYEIYLQLTGRRYLFYHNICYTLEPGSLAIFRPFELHYAESREVTDYARCVVNFRSDVLRLLLSEEELSLLLGKLTPCVIQLNKEQTDKLEQRVRLTEYATHQSGFLADKLLASALLQLVMSVIQYTAKTPPAKGQTIAPEIITALQYIQTHYQETLSLDELAEMVHLSKYYFCRLFHRTTGATVFEYLNNFRLTRVHHLLLYTQLSIEKIAKETGFSTAASLTRTWKKTYPLPPREFRKQYKAAESSAVE